MSPELLFSTSVLCHPGVKSRSLSSTPTSVRFVELSQTGMQVLDVSVQLSAPFRQHRGDPAGSQGSLMVQGNITRIHICVHSDDVRQMWSHCRSRLKVATLPASPSSRTLALELDVSCVWHYSSPLSILPSVSQRHHIASERLMCWLSSFWTQWYYLCLLPLHL